MDLLAHDALIGAIADRARGASRPEVQNAVGLFAGSFRLPAGDGTVLVASTDSVGTKVLLAAELDGHAVVGQDVVIHCVNDVLTLGAEPLFFLDYLAVHTLQPRWVLAIIEGITQACRQAGCALLGGETAQMPDLYRPGAYDLAGTIVGRVPPGRVVRPSGQVGDRIVALPSSGLHTNGFSLVRRILAQAGIDPALHREKLLCPSRLYSPEVLGLLTDGACVRGMAHITGGGLPGNLNRALPPGIDARIDPGSWEVPAVFVWLREVGGVAREEMRAVFNLGVGFCLIVPPEEADAVCRRLSGAWIIGELVPGEGQVVFAC